jgi:hypothetical protein
MRLVLFRNFPARAQNFICERLVREGWFGQWDVASAFDPYAEKKDIFTERPLSIGEANILKREWEKTERMWQQYGDTNYLLNSSEEFARLNRLAGQFREYMRSRMLDAPQTFDEKYEKKLVREDLPAEQREGYDAMVFLTAQTGALNVTNLNHFYRLARVEKEDRAILGRRYLFEGEDRRQDSSLRIRKYLEGLQIWSEILHDHPELRDDSTLQQELYEYQLKYLYHYQQQVGGGKALARTFVMQDLMATATASPVDPQQMLLALGQLEQFDKSSSDWPAPFVYGPLDGTDDLRRPYITAETMDFVAGRFLENAQRAGRPAKVKPQTAGSGQGRRPPQGNPPQGRPPRGGPQ